MGVRLCVPRGWKIEQEGSLKTYSSSVRLTSPDYKEDPDASFGGSKSGAIIYLEIREFKASEPGHTSIASILDGTVQSKLYYSDAKKANVAGYEGASFIVGYEGPRSLTNRFENGNHDYSISISEDLDGPSFNEYQSVYEKVVESLKLQ